MQAPSSLKELNSRLGHGSALIVDVYILKPYWLEFSNQQHMASRTWQIFIPQYFNSGLNPIPACMAASIVLVSLATASEAMPLPG